MTILEAFKCKVIYVNGILENMRSVPKRGKIGFKREKESG